MTVREYSTQQSTSRLVRAGWTDKQCMAAYTHMAAAGMERILKGTTVSGLSREGIQ